MKYKGFFVLMLIITLLSALVTLLPSVLVQYWRTEQQVIDIVKLLTIVLAMIGALILSIGLVYLREKFAKDYNKRNFYSSIEDYVAMKYDYIIKEGPMNLLERIVMGVNNTYMYMTGDYINIWANLIVVVVSVVLMGFISLPVSGILLFTLPLNYFSYKLLNKELERRSSVMQQSTGSGWQKVLSLLQNTDYIKQSSDVDHKNMYRWLESPVERVYSSMASVNQYARSISVFISGMNNIIRTGLLLYIVYLFSIDHANHYSLIIYTILVPIYFSAVSGITNLNLNKKQFDVYQAFKETMRNERENKDGLELEKINRVGVNVRQLGVGDRYVDCHIEGEFVNGDIIWVRGESGKGKSTFAKGLAKFRVMEGLTFNQIEIEKYSADSIRKRVQYLPQEPAIIQGTLRDNLFLGHTYSEAQEKKFIETPFLNTIFDKKVMDDEILPGGSNLSGGEKQKIALARCLAQDADVLILDEITSNIDEETSKSIYHLICETRNDRITFIISHDPLPDNVPNKVIEF